MELKTRKEIHLNWELDDGHPSSTPIIYQYPIYSFNMPSFVSRKLESNGDGYESTSNSKQQSFSNRNHLKDR